MPMPDAWACLCAVLADPSASRLLIEQLARLPAAVRRHREVAPANRDPGLPDYEHARLWRELGREGDR